MHLVNMAIDWAGFYTDNAFPQVDCFWSEPIGLFVSFSIFVCSALNIFHPGIDDNLFDRVWYTILSIVMFCAFVGGLRDGYEPHNIIKTLVILLSVRCIASVVQRHYHWVKHKTPQKTLGM